MRKPSTFGQRPVFSIMMTGTLAVLLPLLAVLQYRWIGQVSEAEADRLSQTLLLATYRSVSDINEEFNQIVREFVIRQPPSRFGSLTEDLLASFTEQITEDYESWQATSLNSSLLRDVYLYNERGGEFRRYDPLTSTLTAEAPPIARLSRWIDDPDDIPEAFLSPEVLPEGQVWVVSDVLINTGRRQRFAPGTPPAENRLLFEIDPDVLWGEIVPNLVATRFDQMDYKVAIEDPRTGRLLYASDESVTADIVADADSRQTIEPRRQRPFELIAPQLQVVAQHELGSLADAVESARRRNLAVGFGILALLGATGAMVILWSERVRSVGRLQMEFAAGISHELRTPLATILTAAHNIASGIVNSPEQVREYAGIVQSEGRRLSAMVDQSIQFAQTEAGRRHYALLSVRVHDVVERAVQTALPSAEESGNRIDVHADPELPAVLADETALAHCLVNLLTNAVKFGPADRPIVIDARHDGAGHVLLSVHNEGPGIDVDELPNLFEPFYRGHNTANVPGSGLGLSLVRRMMAGQKGEVTVDTGPNRGATFTLHIPVAPAGTPDRIQA